MPIFEYKCLDCDRITAILVQNADQFEQPACKHCHSRNVKKLLSQISVHVKGSHHSHELCCGRQEPCEHASHSCSGSCCHGD